VDQHAAVAVELADLRTAGAGPVSVSLRTGEILGLVGLRGGGQESIGRVLFGLEKPAGGSIRLGGTDVVASTPLACIRSGIGFVSSKREEDELAMTLTVRENLFLSHFLAGRGPLDWIGRRHEADRAHQVLSAFDIRPRDPEVAIGTLSGGNQQRVVLARWLAPGRCSLLILEDPTLGVDVGAKVDVYNELTRMVREGLSVVLVSSDFDEVCTICDRALVFNHGRVVSELDRDMLSPGALTTAATG
jgi:ribose transport system ATP-binding protein